MIAETTPVRAPGCAPGCAMVARVSAWILDLDGVVWRGDELIPGADVAVRALLDGGHAVLGCTNHAMAPGTKHAALERLGVPVFPVATSAEAVATLCSAGERVLALGDVSLVEVLLEYELDAIDVFDRPDGQQVPDVDVVVVGSTDRWDRSRIGMVADSIRSGARFLATNTDATHPSTGPFGARLLPGNGVLVAAVTVAADRGPDEVAGKPHPAMAALLTARCGPIDVVVGDRPETDGRLAAALGARFGLVLSGVTGAHAVPVVPSPTWVAADLAEMVDVVAGRGPSTGRSVV